MELILIGLATAIAVAVIGFFIVQVKANGEIEKFYYSYQILFIASGEMIKKIDAQLYKEMEELLIAMKNAYNSPCFSEKELKEIMDEAKDVYDEVIKLLK